MFRSAHDALTFAFRYASQQAPRTALVNLMHSGALGTGKGLIGVEGAGQAGIVLSALRHLSAEQRNLLIVRYGDVRNPCPCCGQEAPTGDWLVALDALSHCTELADLPRSVRHAAVEKIVCRRRSITMRSYASAYNLPARTVQQRTASAKARLAKVENAALSWLDDHFQARSLTPA